REIADELLEASRTRPPAEREAPLSALAEIGLPKSRRVAARGVLREMLTTTFPEPIAAALRIMAQLGPSFVDEEVALIAEVASHFSNEDSFDPDEQQALVWVVSNWHRLERNERRRLATTFVEWLSRDPDEAGGLITALGSLEAAAAERTEI